MRSSPTDESKWQTTEIAHRCFVRWLTLEFGWDPREERDLI